MKRLKPLKPTGGLTESVIQTDLSIHDVSQQYRGRVFKTDEEAIHNVAFEVPASVILHSKFILNLWTSANADLSIYIGDEEIYSCKIRQKNHNPVLIRVVVPIKSYQKKKLSDNSQPKYRFWEKDRNSFFPHQR